jgi:Peptidase family M28
MLIAHSKNVRPKMTDSAIVDALRAVSSDRLLAYVDVLSFPRHYVAERRANVRARDLLFNLLKTFGYTPVLQGDYDNIVATCGDNEGPFLLLGAHYDSVPGCPGADDNGSAVAVCLECARLLKQHHVGPTMIVLFNCEEDGLLGSRDFVRHLSAQSAWAVEESHIFEMVGFCTRTPGSQRMPPGVPGVFAPSVGDFLGLLANRHSNGIAENLLTLAATYIPQFPVVALKTYLGIERLVGDLLRSDHAPFWEAGIASVMWTDTANFRNPNYHCASDTPETLDYAFLSKVAQLILARVLSRV